MPAIPRSDVSLERGKNNTHFDNSKSQVSCKGAPPVITEVLPARSEIIDPTENAHREAERGEVKSSLADTLKNSFRFTL